MLFHVYVFNHNNDLIIPRRIKTYTNRDDAFKASCRILNALVKNAKEDLYVFMEEKKMTFDNFEYKGVHIYNGNISWSVFATNCVLEKPIIGPIGCKDISSLKYSGTGYN